MVVCVRERQRDRETHTHRERVFHTLSKECVMILNMKNQLTFSFCVSSFNFGEEVSEFQSKIISKKSSFFNLAY